MGVLAGHRCGPFEAVLGADLIRQYAQATRDPSPLAQSGAVAPAAAVVTQIWDAQEQGRRELVTVSAAAGVHGEHDIVLHRPIVPGEALIVHVEGHSARAAGRNARVTLRYLATAPDGELVAEQWWTTVYLGVTCDTVGAPPPDHAFPASARHLVIGTYSIEVDSEMPRRYAEVSGDWSAHHFDPEAARRSGFDRPFLHGLCTLALCSQGVVHLVADGDPRRVRRVAVRFAAPTFVGEWLDVSVYDSGPLGYAFEAISAGTTVITHGRLELR